MLNTKLNETFDMWLMVSLNIYQITPPPPPRSIFMLPCTTTDSEAGGLDGIRFIGSHAGHILFIGVVMVVVVVLNILSLFRGLSVKNVISKQIE